MMTGLIGLFASGIYFDLFGKPIDFQDVGAYVFFGSIWFACFGFFLRFCKAWTAFRLTVIVAVIFLAIFAAGALSRGEL